MENFIFYAVLTDDKLSCYVIEMCDILDIPGYFVMMDIEKVFDFLDHDLVLVKISYTG